MAPNQLFDRDTMNAPWGLPARLLLVRMACTFFNAAKLADSYKLIGREVPKGRNLEPLTANDFLKCLEVSNAFPKPPNGLRVMQLIDGMVSGGLLVRAGHGNRSFAGMGDHYVHVTTEWDARREHFRYAPVLGPEFLYYLCAPGLVHITGTGKKTGDAAAGTGLIVHPSYVLTCRHVVTDMLVDQKQTIQGQEYAVNEGSVFRHPAVDVAVIRVDGPPMSPLQGAVFQRPVVGQTVHTLGYPRLPGLRDANVTIQPGAVTNEAVKSLSGEDLFLYSAISRPGNSGGPVVSEDGYVVGLSIVDATAEYHPEEPFSPHYAGIPAQVVVWAIESLGLGFELPLENYE